MTLDSYQLRFLLLEIFGDARDRTSGEFRKGLARLHQVSIGIRRNGESVQDLIQHLPVLASDADLQIEFRQPPQRENDGSQFDCFRTRPQNNRDSHPFLYSKPVVAGWTRYGGKPNGFTLLSQKLLKPSASRRLHLEVKHLLPNINKF